MSEYLNSQISLREANQSYRGMYMQSIFTPTCPYCKEKAELVSGKIVYPRFPHLYNRHYWACIPCNAYVGTHINSKSYAPLGRIADKQLRGMKILAHKYFDKLWNYKSWTRSEGYAWLANELGIPKNECHIGMFDVETCERVIKICGE